MLQVLLRLQVLILYEEESARNAQEFTVLERQP
jgi:hypothetical protein